MADGSVDAAGQTDAARQMDAARQVDAARQTDATLQDGRVLPDEATVGLAPEVGLTIAHDTSCAIVQSALYCWGSAEYGQFGDGTRDAEPHPVPIKISIPDVVFVSLSRWANHVVTAQGELWVAGVNNRDQLPFESATFKRVQIDPVSMAVGSYDVGCVVMAANGEVFCQGKNDTGSVGDGSTENRSSFVSTGLRNVSYIAAGLESVCAISEGDLYCWGHNDKGQIGNGEGGEGEYAASPSKVALPGDVSHVALGSNHTCAATTNGEVYCWGMNWGGQAGGLSDAEKCDVHNCVRNPTKQDIADVEALALSDGASCALTTSGTISCWGAGAVVAGGAKVSSATAIASGQESNHFCARTTSDVVCWGNTDAEGQLGRGTVQNAEQAAEPAPIKIE